MTATHSYQATLTLQQELDNVKMFYPEIHLGLDQMNIPKQFLKTNLCCIFHKERAQMIAVIQHEQEFTDQITDHARMAEMEADPQGPVFWTIGPKSDLALWLEMLPPLALNGTNCFITAEYDTIASAVDCFKVSLTTLHGVLSVHTGTKSYSVKYLCGPTPCKSLWNPSTKTRKPADV